MKKEASDTWLKPQMDRKNQNGFRSPDAKCTEQRKVHAHLEAEESEMDDSSNAL